MTSQQYKKANEINEEIEIIDTLLYRIDKLISSDKVYCNIDMPKQSMYKRSISSYYSENTDLIKKILEQDKIELQRNKSILEDKLKEI